jgi:hypothetical protein
LKRVHRLADVLQAMRGRNQDWWTTDVMSVPWLIAPSHAA